LISGRIPDIKKGWIIRPDAGYQKRPDIRCIPNFDYLRYETRQELFEKGNAKAVFTTF
jgi:hypothetical protein